MRIINLNIINKLTISYVIVTAIIYFLFIPQSLKSLNTFSGDEGNKAVVKEWLKYQQTGFIENKGQFADNNGKPAHEILFKVYIKNLNICITTSGISYYFVKQEEEEGQKEGEKTSEEHKVIEWNRMNMFLVGASIKKENIITEFPLKEYFNYYLAHCLEGVTNVNSFQKITIKEIYPGIDWILYCNKEQGLKYDFVVHPGANPENICMKYDGAGAVQEYDNGKNLLIKTHLGEIQEGTIHTYIYDSKQTISSSYVINGNEVRFKINSYDTTQTLVIDPPLQLKWSTFYGGVESDGPKDITVDNAGNVYITGYSGTQGFPTFPLTGAYNQGVIGGTLNTIIIKFDNAGNRLWATYFGGSSWDYGYGIAIDLTGSIYISGMTDSPIFPVQNLAGAYFQGAIAGGMGHDIYIAKFDNAGARLWATFYGGSGEEASVSNFGLGGITTDNMNNLYVTGYTQSTNFPTLNPGGGAYFQPTNAGAGTTWDAFILKFNSVGVRQWATYYGGSGDDGGAAVATDIIGNVYVSGTTSSTNFPTLNPAGGAYFQIANGGGNDAFVLKFNNACVRQWATYYGGNDDDECHWNSIDADQLGNIYMTGQTQSFNFPLQNLAGAYNQPAKGTNWDVFILKFNTTGVRSWATYYGGNDEDGFSNYTANPGLSSIITDASGNVYLAGSTESSNLYTFNPGGGAYYQPAIAGVQDDFILQFDAAGACQWATYYGGSGGSYMGRDFATGITVNKFGCVFVTGELVSTTGIALINPGGGAYYQTTSGGGDDGYILKFCYNCIPPTVTISLVDDTICEGDSAVFTTQTVGDSLNYQWYFKGNPIAGATDSTYIIYPASVNDTGSYYCIINNSCDEDTSNTVVLTVLTPSVITLQPNDQTICEGDDATFIISTTGSDTINYQWYFNGNTITGATDSSYTVNSASTNDSGSYYCIVNNSCGSDTSDTATLVILTPPVINAQPADQTICEGDSAIFMISATGSDTISYQWYFNGNAINGATDSIYIIISAAVNNAGNYYCIVSNVCGSDTSDLAALVVNTPPDDFYLGNDTTLCDGARLFLDADDLGVNYTYLWQDASTRTYYTVIDSGYYWLTISNSCGSATDSIFVRYKDCSSELWVPNAFTPNGDGNNDIFRADGYNITEFEMFIYDRWGELLFTSNDINVGWDGTYKDRDCQDGVYVWLIKYEGLGSGEQMMTGRATLVR